MKEQDILNATARGIKKKDMEDYEWSMGNGQCPVCYGSAPNQGWWTDYIGHEDDCVLAETMLKAGFKPVMKILNEDRMVGMYDSGSGFMENIKWNDPEKEEKLKIAKEQHKEMMKDFSWDKMLKDISLLNGS